MNISIVYGSLTQNLMATLEFLLFDVTAKILSVASALLVILNITQFKNESRWSFFKSLQFYNVNRKLRSKTTINYIIKK